MVVQVFISFIFGDLDRKKRGGGNMKYYPTEYITIKTHPHLVGKRARFKQKLPTYCSFLWGAKGTITQLFQIREGDLDYVGLSIVFDKPKKRFLDDPFPMKSCYILPNSYELVEQ